MTGSTPLLRGIHIPLITPFTPEDRVDLDALRGLAHAVADEGAAGLVALGTTAEAAALDETERRDVIGLCAQVAAERELALTIGAGGGDTRSAADALRTLAEWPQATAALVPVPSFTRPGAAGVLAHFTVLAEASPVPLIVYHIPYRTGQALSAADLRALGRLPNVAGVKYAVGGIDAETVDLLGDAPDGFAILAGDDAYLSPMLALGAHGGILASAHLATRRFAELHEAWARSDPDARELGHRLARLSAAAFAAPNPAVTKGVLYAQGRIASPHVRLPLLPAEPELVEAAAKALAELGG